MISTYKGKSSGHHRDFGCFSFHETKNYSMGEGGALLIRESEYNERAEILREKGTNRAKFFRGQVDKYTWVDYGFSYLPSEMNAAYLYAQLLEADRINNDRLAAGTPITGICSFGAGRKGGAACPARGLRAQRPHVLARAACIWRNALHLSSI